MVSSWTAALLYQQLTRYSAILRHMGKANEAAVERLSLLANAIRSDFNRYLMADGVVAGYALFHPGKAAPDLLLHPADERTGVKYSLIPMTCAITGGLFTPEQARHHLRIIQEHLLFPDGVRLMDRPIAYHGGAEVMFRRATTASFFGREVGLMYVHAHLRYCEALAAMGETEAFWNALQVVNPITVTELLQNAGLRQRNSYFSSSDAAFHDRYEAASGWHRVKDGSVSVEAGWRVYSGGPGLYVHLLLGQTAGTAGRAWAQALPTA
jgi:cellobiose phosphorylase